MDFLITSYESVGSIKFGMSIEEVRSFLNSSVKTFMKTSSSELPSDAFYQLGLQIYYKHPEICNAIELASPANPIFQSQSLLGRPFSEVCRWFEQRDSSLEIFDSGLTILFLWAWLICSFCW
jgi:hypothetical protein